MLNLRYDTPEAHAMARRIAELLRETWPGIPAVFVSAASRGRLSELAPLGPIIAKPFDIDRFREAVLTAVEAPADRWRIR